MAKRKRIKQLFFINVCAIMKNITYKEKLVMQEITYRIYAYESVSDGKFFSNFYGRCFSKSI